jgi:DNA-binding transcriptional MerR regulator
MPSEAYSIAEIADRLCKAGELTDLPGITRLIRYWVSEGLLRPIGSIKRGRGRDRVFECPELLRSAILLELSKYNVTANSMKFMMQELELEIERRNMADLLELIGLPSMKHLRFGAPSRTENYLLLDTNRRPTPRRLRSFIYIDGQGLKTDLGIFVG